MKDAKKAKSTLKAFLVIAIVIAVISFGGSVYYTVLRVLRADWIVTDAEITLISSLSGGEVLGTFTDYNGKVHAEKYLYSDGDFVGFGIGKPIFPPLLDPDKYIGTTVRIMYAPDPQALDEDIEGTSESDIDIESYDNWLQGFIIMVSVFGVSLALTAVFSILLKRKRTRD